MVASKAAETFKHGISTDSNHSPPPPAYAQDNPHINVPDITAAFSNLNLAISVKPTPDLCIAHLKLLEAFHQLREDVAREDGRFGISDAFADAAQSDEERNKILAKIREKRWQVYVTMASKRFERWWITSVEPKEAGNRLLGQAEMASLFKRSPDLGERLEWSKDDLPPLGEYHSIRWFHVYLLVSKTDVIMVWHAYMLNPRDFLEDCLRQGKMKFWRAGMPWMVIDPCIDNNTFEYNASDGAVKRFEDRTGYNWNSLSACPNATIECPSCRRTLNVPWTRWDSPDIWKNGDYGTSTATGFSDKNFEAVCKCGIVIDHETLRVQKFREDIQALRNLGVPMPGTLFSHTGSYLSLLAYRVS